MVPIKEAISSGAWLHCEYQGYNDLIKFRLKVNSFRKLNLKEIDNPEEIKGYDSNSVIWIFEIEVINLTKNALNAMYGPNKLNLVDVDGFCFPIFRDDHLTYLSNFSKKAGLRRFFGLIDLLPKIKAVGCITFQLPDDDDAEYFISIENNGIVQEV